MRRVLDTEDLEDPTDWRRARDHGVRDDDEGDRGRDDDDDDDEDDDEDDDARAGVYVRDARVGDDGPGDA